MAKGFISIEALSKRFAQPGGELVVFDDLWFEIQEGEFVCIIGHSGCGKSTILNGLAGLDKPSAGTIVVGGKHVDGPSLDRAVIFQSHALMPWLSALGNVELAASSRHRDWPRAKVRAPHAAHEAEAVAAHTLDARLMVIGRADPAPRLGDDAGAVNRCSQACRRHCHYLVEGKKVRSRHRPSAKDVPTQI
jgi:ABC-type nitrate/sulfonate/bicarbonate transport system ATPase subunit